MNASSFSQLVAHKATVSSSSGVTVNEGTVTFTVLGTGGQPVNGSVAGKVMDGQARVTYYLPAGLPPGRYTILASYSDPYSGAGTGRFNSASGFGTLTTLATNTGGNPGGSTSQPPSLLQAAFTIALDAAEMVLEANGFGVSLFPPPLTLLDQILADLPYAEGFALPALQASIQAAQQIVNT